MTIEHKLRKLYMKYGEKTFLDEYLMERIVQDIFAEAPECELIIKGIKNHVVSNVVNNVVAANCVEEIQQISNQLVEDGGWNADEADRVVRYFVCAKFGLDSKKSKSDEPAKAKVENKTDVKKRIRCIYKAGAVAMVIGVFGYVVAGNTQLHKIIRGEENKTAAAIEAYSQAKSNTLTAFDEYAVLAGEGNAVAQYSLGIYYYYGEEYGYLISQNYSEAIRWFKAAADQGYTDAQVLLGDCYYYGNGTRRDIVEAEAWYVKAANKGNERAKEMLMLILAERAKIVELEQKAEQERLAEIARVAAIEQKAEQERLAEIARVAAIEQKAEQERLAEIARVAAIEQKAEQERLAEIARVAAIEQKAEQERLAEIARVAAIEQKAEQERLLEIARAEKQKVLEAKLAEMETEMARIAADLEMRENLKQAENVSIVEGEAVAVVDAE